MQQIVSGAGLQSPFAAPSEAGSGGNGGKAPSEASTTSSQVSFPPYPGLDTFVFCYLQRVRPYSCVATAMFLLASGRDAPG